MPALPGSLSNLLITLLLFYRFAFEARVWPNGHYVHTLAGKKEEPRGYDPLATV